MPPTRPSIHVIEHRAASEKHVEELLGVNFLRTSSVKVVSTGGTAATTTHGGLLRPEPVVTLPLLRIAQTREGSRDRLERVLGTIHLALVRVKLQSKLLVRPLDHVLAALLVLNAQNLVVVCSKRSKA